MLLRLEMMGMFLVTSRGSGGRKVGRSTSDREEPRTRVSCHTELVCCCALPLDIYLVLT